MSLIKNRHQTQLGKLTLVEYFGLASLAAALEVPLIVRAVCQIGTRFLHRIHDERVVEPMTRECRAIIGALPFRINFVDVAIEQTMRLTTHTAALVCVGLQFRAQWARDLWTVLQILDDDRQSIGSVRTSFGQARFAGEPDVTNSLQNFFSIVFFDNTRVLRWQTLVLWTTLVGRFGIDSFHFVELLFALDRFRRTL